MAVIVRRLRRDELPWANERYAEINFSLAGEQDLVVVAEVDQLCAGLGRLVEIEAQVGELGGIYVLPSFRSQALAAAIVAYLLAHSNYRTVYCIAFTRLEHLYTRFGFKPITREWREIPSALRDKYNWCASHYAQPVAVLERIERRRRPPSLAMSVEQ